MQAMDNNEMWKILSYRLQCSAVSDQFVEMDYAVGWTGHVLAVLFVVFTRMPLCFCFNVYVFYVSALRCLSLHLFLLLIFCHCWSVRLEQSPGPCP